MQGQRFGLGRDDQAVGCGQCIDHQQAEGGCAVQQDVVVLSLVARQRVLQGQAEAGLVGAAALQRGQRGLCADIVQAVDAAGMAQAGKIGRRGAEQFQHAGRRRIHRHAEGAAERGMRIEIDQQHAMAKRGQAAAEGEGGGGLADSALLVGDCPDAHRITPSLPGERRRRRGCQPAPAATSPVRWGRWGRWPELRRPVR